MFAITRQYKVGRGIGFYDLTSLETREITRKVAKDEVVKKCESGEICNAKIQWWQGAPIVRIKTEGVPIVKADSGQAVEAVHRGSTGTASTSTSTANRHAVEHSNVEDISSKGHVVGKLQTGCNIAKDKKKETVFAGYDRKNVYEQMELRQEIKYSSMRTVGDLLEQMMKEFNLKKTDLYRSNISKKIPLDKEIKSVSQGELGQMQSAMASYLMNMANNEARDTYLKYMPLVVSD